MPVTVTVSRGNPLPWPIALVLSVVGAALMVVGFTVIPPVPGMDNGASRVILGGVALLIIVPTLLISALVLVRRTRRRQEEADAVADVPEELAEPPSRHDAAIVSTVVGRGTPSRRAVAGTILELANARVLTIHEYGPKVVLALSDRDAPTPEAALVVASLHERRDDSGDVSGPPFWDGKVPWWRDFARGARNRAITEGLLEPRIPFVGLILFTVMIATAVSLIFFARTAVFVGCILFAVSFPHLIARASGVRLSIAGQVERARWLAFGRYLRAHGSFRDVGPAGVTVWGPNLVYGVVLGEAPRVARALTPEGDDDIEDPAPSTQVYEL